METTEPITTDFGIISGRNAFYLNDVNLDYPKLTVSFSGDINGNLCSNLPKKGITLPYTLTFRRVMAFRQTELDLFDGPYDSSFFILADSEWMTQMREQDHSQKLKPEHRHFILYTYDDVFDIVAESYELIVANPQLEDKG